MNAIQELQDKPTHRLPPLRVSMDKPESERGDWFLDIFRGYGRAFGCRRLASIVSTNAVRLEASPCSPGS
jgi:hypothetical protein